MIDPVPGQHNVASKRSRRQKQDLPEAELVFLPHPDAARRIRQAYALILEFAGDPDDEPAPVTTSDREVEIDDLDERRP